MERRCESNSPRQHLRRTRILCDVLTSPGKGFESDEQPERGAAPGGRAPPLCRSAAVLPAFDLRPVSRHRRGPRTARPHQSLSDRHRRRRRKSGSSRSAARLRHGGTVRGQSDLECGNVRPGLSHRVERTTLSCELARAAVRTHDADADGRVRQMASRRLHRALQYGFDVDDGRAEHFAAAVFSSRSSRWSRRSPTCSTSTGCSRFSYSFSPRSSISSSPAFTRMISASTKRAQESIADLSANLSEVLQGQRIVKAFGREAFEVERFERSNETYFSAFMKVLQLGLTQTPIVAMIITTALLAIMAFSVREAIVGRMTSGQVFQFWTLVVLAINPLNRLASFVGDISKGLIDTARVFEILDLPIEECAAEGALRPEHVAGAIAFERVTFAYKPGGVPTLHDLSATIDARDHGRGRRDQGANRLPALQPDFSAVRQPGAAPRRAAGGQPARVHGGGGRRRGKIRRADRACSRRALHWPTTPEWRRWTANTRSPHSSVRSRRPAITVKKSSISSRPTCRASTRSPRSAPTCCASSG